MTCCVLLGMGCRATKHQNSVGDELTTEKDTNDSKFSFITFVNFYCIYVCYDMT